VLILYANRHPNIGHSSVILINRGIDACTTLFEGLGICKDILREVNFSQLCNQYSKDILYAECLNVSMAVARKLQIAAHILKAAFSKLCLLTVFSGM